MPLAIEPTGATLGAIVTGVDLATLDAAAWNDLEAAFHEHAVLIFPGQHLSSEAQIALGARFGEIEHLSADRDIVPISNKSPDGGLAGDDSHQMQILRGNEGWHTDSSYMPLSAKASVLSARVVPAAGGQTEWADMRAAYDVLDDATKERIAELAAYHSLFHSQAKIGHEVAVGGGYGFFEGDPPLRPLVKMHPVTGRKALYIGRHAYGIPGLDPGDSLLGRIIQRVVRRPHVRPFGLPTGGRHHACGKHRRFGRQRHVRAVGVPAFVAAQDLHLV